MRLAAYSLTYLSVAALVACETPNPVASKYKPSPPSGEVTASATPLQFGVIATANGNGGSLQVIAIGAQDSLPYLVYQTTSGNWYWAGNLPNPNGIKFGAVATGRGNGGSLQVIGIGADGYPYLIYQTTSGNWYWAGRLPSDVRFRAIATGAGNGGSLQVIGIGRDDLLPYLIYQTTGGSWHWGGRLPSAAGIQFFDVRTGRVRLQGSTELHLGAISLGFGFPSTGRPYLIAQDVQSGTWYWKGAIDEAAEFTTVATGPGNGSTLFSQVIGLLGNGLPLGLGQTGTGDWAVVGLPHHDVPLKAIATGLGNNGYLQLIGVGASDGLPYLMWYDNSAWNWRGLLPNPGVPFSAIATGKGNGGSLQVIGIGANDGLLYVVYQTTSGNWYWGGKLPSP